MEKHLYESLQILENEKTPFSKEERLKGVTEPLLYWFSQNARILPWRTDPAPYRVWVSEIMLQQTRVEAVKPYFARFMEALPDIRALAGVSEDTLMKLWEGLGYYNRARNLKKAAIEAVERYGGELPGDYEKLLALPGIGSYTAGAVASIAFGIPVPAVDGNVLRVISRLLESREDILSASVKKQMEADLRAVMPKDRAGEYNQALMEIGATVCIPNGQPKCEECPMESLCLAHRHNTTGEIPVKAKKKKRKREEKTVFLLWWEGKIALQKRPETGLLAGLYEFPWEEGYLSEEEAREWILKKGCEPESVEKPCLAAEEGMKYGWEGPVRLSETVEAKHIFSHVEWHMKGYCALLEKKLPGVLFVEPEKLLREYALPSAYKAYLDYCILNRDRL